MRLLDADVLIDQVRGYPPAVQWLASLPIQPGLTGIALMEVVKGCGNKAELWRLQKLASHYVLYWPSPVDCQDALLYLSLYNLSHSLGLEDALIAATSIGLGATLHTFNTKHFSAVPGLITEQPYERG